MTGTHRSPGMRSVAPYPFEELDRRVAQAVANGRELINFGVGDPREETPAFIREALVDALDPVSSYPRAAGLPELRDAIAAWVERRFGSHVNPDTEILPVLGSKEIVFSLAQLVIDPPGGKDVVITTAPGYPIPGSRAAILWINYPNNPTGAIAPLAFLEEAAEQCRAHDVLLASDEAYSEVWFGSGPPPGALQLPDRTNVLVINTLSKRSSMTGYRSGFVAGDPGLIADLKRLRPATGVTPQEFIQRASVAAWRDEVHVEENRARYRRKRELLLDVFERHGVHIAGSVATFYLWVRVPTAETSLEWALHLLDRGGIVVAPGSFFGPEGEGFVRMAMVPSVEACARAASALDELLAEVRT
ncbi:MAG: aminotransferase class I/II-fold pyridoxal phosphate-dependent enzyme [Actinobacteria bacterium]|nr:MAG: aminotransferase class I/II-fold pyridoxal phosphate-dependent enzyme [Actinomycetota bacterium]